jgi:hypothetical protein
VTGDEREEQMRRVRYWLGEGESALDLSMAALTRAGELDQDWAEEFESDVGVLRTKLDILRQMINGRGGPVPDGAA